MKIKVFDESLVWSVGVWVLIGILAYFNSQFFATIAAGSEEYIIALFMVLGFVFDVMKKLCLNLWVRLRDQLTQIECSNDDSMIQYGKSIAVKKTYAGWSFVALFIVSMTATSGFFSNADKSRREAETIASYGFQAAQSDFEQAKTRLNNYAIYADVSIESIQQKIEDAKKALDGFRNQEAINASGKKAGFTVGYALDNNYKHYVSEYGTQHADLRGALSEAYQEKSGFTMYQSAAAQKNIALHDLESQTTTGGGNHIAPIFNDIALSVHSATGYNANPEIVRIIAFIVVSLLGELLVFIASIAQAEYGVTKTNAKAKNKSFGFVPDNAVTAQYDGNTPRFLNGGAVNYTGYAYVDGTQDKPEYVFNAQAVQNAGGVHVMEALHDVLKRTGAKGRKRDGSANLAYQEAVVAMLYMMGYQSNNDLRKAKKDKSLFGGASFSCGDARMFSFRDSVRVKLNELSN